MKKRIKAPQPDSARHHRRTRAARAVEIAEDYVEAIAELIEEGREARVVDIARKLGVSHVTVNRTVARLTRHGLVSSERYRSVFLTEEGWSMAKEVRFRHAAVLDFLLALGVDEETAHTDAEGIEHHVSRTTLDAFVRFTKKKRRG